MGEKRNVHCPACDRKLPKHGWKGHIRSKAHAAALEQKGMAEVEFIELEGEEPITEAELRRQYEDEIAKLRSELAEAGPAKTSPLMTEENVAQVVGEDQLRAAAELQLVALDRKRRAQSLKPLWDSPDELEPYLVEEIEKLKRELVEQQTSWVSEEGSGTRMLKMVRPDGNMVQVGVEDQINNGAAGPGVNIYMMRDKGFKIAEPHRCELKDCYAAAVFPDEEPHFCSRGHASLIPKALGGNREVIREYAGR